ncbi:MAG: GxxExxY protein [Bacteroidales bacterium]|nr:GxxExxY protein [Bacteroidales bacterium]
MENNNYLYSRLSSKIIQAFYKIYNTLGYGFLEKVYENALMIELNKANLICQQQQHIDVLYEEQKVGDYFADIIVEDKIIIELKAAEDLVPEHEAQLVNYLRATNMEVGLLLNFGKTPQHKRRVLTNEYKNQ